MSNQHIDHVFATLLLMNKPSIEMKKTIYYFALALMVASCGNSESTGGNMLPTEAQSRSAKKESNAITQSMPSVMVIT